LRAGGGAAALYVNEKRGGLRRGGALRVAASSVARRASRRWLKVFVSAFFGFRFDNWRGFDPRNGGAFSARLAFSKSKRPRRRCGGVSSSYEM